MCLTGDFNAIRNGKERKGISTQVNRAEMGEFGDFIESLELMCLWK